MKLEHIQLKRQSDFKGMIFSPLETRIKELEFYYKRNFSDL